MAFHDEPRFTEDIDFLIHPADLEKCTRALNGIGFKEMDLPWTFKSNNMTLHRFLKFSGEDHGVVGIMEANEDRHQQMLNRADKAVHDGIGFRIIRLDDLIPLKQERNSEQDRVDIKKLNDAQKNKNPVIEKLSQLYEMNRKIRGIRRSMKPSSGYGVQRGTEELELRETGNPAAPPLPKLSNPE